MFAGVCAQRRGVRSVIELLCAAKEVQVYSSWDGVPTGCVGMSKLCKFCFAGYVAGFHGCALPCLICASQIPLGSYSICNLQLL